MFLDFMALPCLLDLSVLHFTLEFLILGYLPNGLHEVLLHGSAKKSTEPTICTKYATQHSEAAATEHHHEQNSRENSALQYSKYSTLHIPPGY